MSGASFCNFSLQLPKHSEFMYYGVSSWFQEFYIATFFFKICNFSLQLLSTVAQNVKALFKKRALELFQYSSVLFDNRFELNSDLNAIVEMTRPNISPELYAKLLNCQATSCTVERSFSKLRKLLANDRHFSPDNVWKYLALYVNKSLDQITIV